MSTYVLSALFRIFNARSSLLYITSFFPPHPLVAPIVEKPIEPGCDYDDDCPLHKACINRLCLDPCVEDDPCAELALCRVVNHSPVCKCPNGYTGDPKIKCVKRKFTLIMTFSNLCLIMY